jgi:hypothetical protein
MRPERQPKMMDRAAIVFRRLNPKHITLEAIRPPGSRSNLDLGSDVRRRAALVGVKVERLAENSKDLIEPGQLILARWSRADPQAKARFKGEPRRERWSHSSQCER